MSAENVDISVETTLSLVLGEPATYDIAGFSALVYQEVGEITAIPAFGGAAQVAEHIPLKTGIVNKRVGSINYGDVAIPLARDYSDVGQAAIKAGFDGANRGKVHSFKIHNANIGTVYFTGVISSNITEPGDANSFFGGSFTVNLTGKDISTGDADFHQLTYAAGANGQIVGATTQFVANGEDGALVFAAADAGYAFDEWSDASVENPRQDTAVAGDISVTASFVATS